MTWSSKYAQDVLVSSDFSSLLTTKFKFDFSTHFAILFLIGTSIVRGFAVTLGMGVLISMFSAIVITRWLLNHIATSPIGENPALFGVTRPNESNQWV